MLLDEIKERKRYKEYPCGRASPAGRGDPDLSSGTFSRTGGHLASIWERLELTMALHYVFQLPEDKIIWDVGHQSYTHKILTGRKEGFDHLRMLRRNERFPKKERKSL